MYMKSLIKKLALITIVASNLFLASCIKESTPGPQGPQGPQGQPGQDGYDGVVNVDSYTMNVYLNDFQFYSTNREYYLHADVSVANIQSNDAVLVYFYREDFNNHQYWAQLPFDDYYDSFDYNHFSYELGYDGYMLLNIRNSQGVVPYSPMSGTVSYKFIVIRGNYNKKASAPASVNLNDFSAVAKYYNIKDSDCKVIK